MIVIETATGRNLSDVGFPSANLPDGRGASWNQGSLILLPNDMTVRTAEEVVAWGPLDVLSAIGGFYAIIGTFILTFHGEGNTDIFSPTLPLISLRMLKPL
jgi:hypothetical protein